MSKDNVEAITRTWSEGISMHGLPHVMARWRVWKRVLWAVIFLTCIGVMTWQMSVLITDFLKYDTEYSTEENLRNRLPFPQVTVCNANLFQQSLKNATGIAQPVNNDEVRAISQSFDDFMLWWGFNLFVPDDPGRLEPSHVDGAPSWVEVITPFGLCWQFQAGGVGVTRPNGAGGLQFVVDIDQDEYEAKTDAAGIVVIVQQSGDVVVDESSFEFVEPGVFTRVAIERIEVKRETDKPWKSCISKAPEYSLRRCRFDCVNVAVTRLCNCTRLGDNARERASLPLCDGADTALMLPQNCRALNAELELLEAGGDGSDVLDCDCSKPPCEDIQLRTRVSSLAFPSVRAAEDIQRRFGFSAEDLEENVVNVLVNYETISFTTLTESKKETVAQLMSNIGGQLGMYAGISFISIYEVLGDLIVMRLMPRLWGDTRHTGLGTLSKESTALLD
jgi:acid-sensing ion channel 5